MAAATVVAGVVVALKAETVATVAAAVADAAWA